MTPELAGKLRAWARGAYASEAGVELLIRSGLADRMASAGWIATSDTDPEVYRDYAWPDVNRLLQEGGLSGGERRMALVALNLLGQDERPVDALSLPNLAGLDYGNCRLVLAAISHAMGTHQMDQTRPVFLGDGRVELETLERPALVGWPE